MRIFSGIQPTGAKHLGNYAGGFRQYAATQEQGEAFFCIVDLHSISVEYDPDDLRERTLDLLAILIATGLDPERSTIFAQSHVPAHAEANWLLSSVDELRRARRMTQFKDKSDEQEFVSAGAVHLPGAPGRRHPALPDRHRPGRRATSASTSSSRATSPSASTPLRRDVHAAERRLPRGRGEDHGPPGAREEDVDDGWNRAGNRVHRSTRPTRSGGSSRPRSPTPAARSSTRPTSRASRTSSRS